MIPLIGGLLRQTWEKSRMLTRTQRFSLSPSPLPPQSASPEFSAQPPSAQESPDQTAYWSSPSERRSVSSATGSRTMRILNIYINIYCMYIKKCFKKTLPMQPSHFPAYCSIIIIFTLTPLLFLFKQSKIFLFHLHLLIQFKCVYFVYILIVVILNNICLN